MIDDIFVTFSSTQTNKRTRDRAFDILVQIGHACGDAERGGTREHRHKFFDMVLNFFQTFLFENRTD